MTDPKTHAVLFAAAIRNICRPELQLLPASISADGREELADVLIETAGQWSIDRAAVAMGSDPLRVPINRALVAFSGRGADDAKSIAINILARVSILIAGEGPGARYRAGVIAREIAAGAESCIAINADTGSTVQ